MNFRNATEDDLDAIVALLADDTLGVAREAPGDPAYLSAYREMQTQVGNHLIVAEDAGKILGCLQLTIIPGLSRKGAKRGQIESVRVAASHRSRGLGAKLFAFAIQRARDEGCSLVQLTTDRMRPAAHKFYERLGFIHSHAGYKLPL